MSETASGSYNKGSINTLGRRLTGENPHWCVNIASQSLQAVILQTKDYNDDDDEGGSGSGKDIDDRMVQIALDQGVGYGVVIGLGALFALGMCTQ